MSRLPQLKAREVIRALKMLGFEIIRQKGSHAFMKHSSTGRSTIVSVHGGEDIDRSLLHLILKETEISPEEFIEALKR